MSAPSTKLYAKVFGALLVLLGVTLGAARLDLGAWNVALALAIACVKAGVVGYYFMHLRWSEPLVRLAAAVAALMVALLIGGTLQDAVSRPWDPGAASTTAGSVK